MSTSTNFKRGQAVRVKTNFLRGRGVVKAVNQTGRGIWYEVELEDGARKSFRAAALTAV